MELACPTCQRQLALAEPLPSHLVQCPFCATVMDVSGLLGAASSVQPASPAFGMGASPAPSPTAAATLEIAPAATSRTGSRVVRHRRNNSGWGLLVLSIVVGLAAIPVAMYMMQRNRDELAQRAKASQPSTVAYGRAQDFVRQLLPGGGNGIFSEDFQSQKQNGGRWSIAAHVDVPMQSGPAVRKPWTAELTQRGNEWTLLRLEVAGEVLTSNEARRQPRVEFTPVGAEAGDDENWFTGGSDGDSSGNSFYGEQTVPWAVDLVGEEIKDAVGLRKTLVVWLIDKSASAAGHRADALTGMSAIYQEVDEAASAESRRARLEDKPLLSAVAAFGDDIEYLVEEPTDDGGKIEAALSGILEDGTGVEKTFAAIQAAVEKYLPYQIEQDRALMVVVVSDEAGDDDAAIQDTLALLQQHAVPVSIVGARVPFGRQALPGVGGPEMGTDVMNPGRGATLRQGPETPQSEHINLAFWNPSYGAEDAEYLDSGFGPYSLTRLANESGGRYYACRTGFSGISSRTSFNPGAGMLHYFDPEVMKDYTPEYVTPEEYAELLAENKARQALIDAARLPRVEAMKFVRLDFPKFADEAQKASVLGDAQKAAAVVEPRVGALYEALKKGEADRPKLTGRRWQAAFDLAMGRVLAAKVRTEGYNVMLAQLKAGTLTFSNPENDIFLLRPDDSIGAGSSYERFLKQSKMYLERVVAEHPGTPWAFLAERELQVAMGWKWVETRAGAKMDGAETP